jgi:FtsP/CotA-like multicopper oxidase with cupredoxin domain
MTPFWQVKGFVRRPGCSLIPAICAFLAVLGPPLGGMLTAAQAEPGARVVAEPPQVRVMRTGPEPSPTVLFNLEPTPRRAATAGGEAFIELNIRYTAAQIYNPATDAYDNVRLRSYRDAHETTPPKVPFVAPTIEVFPGETVRITLNNRLPAEANCEQPGQDHNVPHCFNRTNLHSHGLWVSPSGNSDNVLLSINPNVSFQYEYNVPADHPAGTYWYHPHRHGSTALQVSSGMAGALIVRGTRLPTPQRRGDVDTLLKDSLGAPLRERVVLFQQIQYACRDADGEIKAPNGLYVCDPTDVGGIEDYDDKQFGPQTWRKSGRSTTINGEVAPTFTGAVAGRTERWRMIHAGVRDTINLQFRKMKANSESVARLAADAETDWLTRNCPGETLLPQFALAADGLTRSRIVEVTTTTLQPGYREDILVVFPEAGDYCVLDGAAPAVSTVNNQAKSPRFLGSVSVAAGQSVPNVPAFVKAELIAAADRNMPTDVRQKVRDDLGNGLKLGSFIEQDDIADGEVTPPLREASFQIGNDFMINGKDYDPQRIDHLLELGATEEWKLSTVNAVGHPFHIHINPFQIVRIIKESTQQDVSSGGDPDEPQYANLKGVWKDTLFVRQGYTAYVRTRYRRYIGDFVLHCHILDHEDKGMMQNVRITLPDGAGGLAPSHH